MLSFAKATRVMSCCALLLALTPCARAAVEAVDSEGRVISIDQPATRVVALAPHIVENLFSVGAQETIVGTVQYSDYPAPAKLIPRVGGVGSMSLEQILAMQPDLIVLWGSGTSPGLRANIERLGLPYFVDEIRSLEELGSSLQALATLTGHAERGHEVATELRQAVSRLSDGPGVSQSDDLSGDLSDDQSDDLGDDQNDEHPNKNRQSNEDTPGVFLQVWDQPLQSIGRSHLLNEVIERCGGQSITRTTVGLAPVISLERVLADDPALIIVENQEQAQHWQRYRQLSATREAGIVVIDPDLLHRPTLRLLAGMMEVCAQISASSDRRKRASHKD